MSFARFTKFTIVCAVALSLHACKKDENPVIEGEQLPTTYNFTNVNYGGQSVRLMLGDSLSRLVKGLRNEGAVAVTKEQLISLYENTNKLYENVATNKKLSDKMYGPLDVQIRSWFDSIEVLSATGAGSNKATTTADGLYLPEFIEKGIMGGVYYYQALKYLNDEVPVADNSTVKEGEGTKMEHNWDEAFGYFGASNRYSEFSIDEMSANPSQKDVNKDGKIDPATEKNFFFARYAASRDKAPTVFTTGQTDFAKTIFNAFIKGRNAISKKDYKARDEASVVIRQTWDKIIAASAIKYAVDCKSSIGNPESLNGRWAELKAFTAMTQYNNQSKLSPDKFAAVMALIGEKPADLTAEKTDQIISALKSAYGF